MWLPWRRGMELAACLVFFLCMNNMEEFWTKSSIYQGALTGRSCIIIFILNFITWLSKGQGVYSFLSSEFFICMTIILQGDLCSQISLRVVGFKMSEIIREASATWRNVQLFLSNPKNWIWTSFPLRSLAQFLLVFHHCYRQACILKYWCQIRK